MIEEIKQGLEAELEILGSRTEARMGENHHDETGKLYFLGGKMAAYEKVEPWLRYLVGEVERLTRHSKEIEEILDSANNAIEPLNDELDYERKENEELRKALEQFITAFAVGDAGHLSINGRSITALREAKELLERSNP